MVSERNRRHSRWYERLVFSLFFQLVAGWFIVVYLPALWFWDEVNPQALAETQRNSLLLTTLAFTGTVITLRNIFRFPGTRTAAYIMPTVIGWYALIYVVVVLGRLDYARSLIFLSAAPLVVLCFLGHKLANRFASPKLALAPYGRAQSICHTHGAQFIQLINPSLGYTRFNGVVADLHAELPAEWQRFLAQCSLNRIPVYHFKQIQESLTGRVKIDHLSENQHGTLTPSPGYEPIKRLIDLASVIIAAPVALPVILVAGIAIKLESPGAILFTQERVGQSGKRFTMYKLRSMVKDSEKGGAQFAQTNDLRVTRVGAFIRKVRIDELPQFWNILKGNMSLIGPRPEQQTFVEEFEKEIPFYSYRHVVKPGITGWAQVRQGYVDDIEDTRKKIEHDFFYIKNFSLWMDILIVLETLKTIVMRRGAR